MNKFAQHNEIKRWTWHCWFPVAAYYENEVRIFMSLLTTTQVHIVLHYLLLFSTFLDREQNITGGLGFAFFVVDNVHVYYIYVVRFNEDFSWFLLSWTSTINAKFQHPSIENTIHLRYETLEIYRNRSLKKIIRW